MSVSSLASAPRAVEIAKEVMNVSVQMASSLWIVILENGVQLMVRWVHVWNKLLPGDINTEEYDVPGNKLPFFKVSITSFTSSASLKISV